MQELDYLNTSQKYASVFVYASGKDAVEKALEGGGRTATLAGGGIAIALGTIAGVSGTTTAIGAAIAGGAVNIWNPLGWALLAGVGIYAVYKATHPEEPQWTSFIAFRPYNETELNDLNCEQLVVNQMSNAGK